MHQLFILAFMIYYVGQLIIFDFNQFLYSEVDFPSFLITEFGNNFKLLINAIWL